MGSHTEDIAKKSSIGFISQVIGKVLLLVYGLLVARIIGADIYGRFTSVFSLLSIMLIAVLMGLQFGLNKRVPECLVTDKKDLAGRVSSFSLFAVFIISSISAIIIFFFKKAIALHILKDESFYSMISILSPLLIIMALDEIQRAIFTSRKVNTYVFVSNEILKPFLKCGAIVLYYFIWDYRDISFFIFVNYFVFILSFIFLGLIALKRRFYSWPTINYLSDYYDVWKFSVPMFLATAISVMLNNFDIICIEYFLSSKDVGIYKVAYSIAYMSTFVSTATNAILGPMISEFNANNDYESIKKYYSLTSKVCFMFSMLFLIEMIVLGRENLLLYGHEFSNATIVLILLTVGQLVVSSMGPIVLLLSNTGNQKYVLYSMISVLMINITLNIIFIPMFGINGAALATAIAVASKNVSYAGYLKKKLNILPYDKSYFKIVLAAIVILLFNLIIKEIIHFEWYIELVIISATILLSFSGAIYFYLMEPKEREAALNMIKRKTK